MARMPHVDVIQLLTMSWMPPVRWPKSFKTCFIDKLSPEVLELIIEELCPEHERYGVVERLLGMCLVSRRMYLLTIPYLYRNIHIDLRRASHLRLLQRLIKPGSQLAGRIRTLTITGTDQTIDVRLLDLYILCSCLTLLREFDWRGSSAIPQVILGTLASRVPNARLMIDHYHLGLDGLASPTPPATLLYPASTQLKCFSFESPARGPLYSNFKSELIYMLQRNPQLECLRLDISDDELWGCPEMLDLLRSGPLPHVRILALGTNLFTDPEIKLCGQRGMFDELMNLRVDRPQLLSLICEGTKTVRELMVSPVVQFDVDDFEARLGSVSENRKTPFDRVHVLHYANYELVDTFIPNRRTVPWCLIERMPKLKTLKLQPFLIEGRGTGMYLDDITAEDFAEIRRLCPDIQEIYIQIALRTPWARWPCDIIEELAMFKKANKLRISLLVADAETTTVKLHRFRCGQIFEHILKRRRASYTTCQIPFRVTFRLVKARAVLDNGQLLPVYRFWMDERGTIHSHEETRSQKRAILDKMTTDQLQGQQKKLSVARRFGWDHKGYGKELKRRERTASPIDGLELHATLWDKWTSQHVREPDHREARMGPGGLWQGD